MESSKPSEPRLLYSGLEMLDYLGRRSRRSAWVGLGTFGLATDLLALRVLPAGSSIIVGLPRDAEEKHSTILLRLRVLKKAFPSLLLATRTDFHAKYALFEKGAEREILVGSANTTSSPAIETCVVFQDDFCFDRLKKRHLAWLKQGQEVHPDQTPKLDKIQLAALKSSPTT